jgi:hypothetical protein
MTRSLDQWRETRAVAIARAEVLQVAGNEKIYRPKYRRLYLERPGSAAKKGKSL